LCRTSCQQQPAAAAGCVDPQSGQPGQQPQFQYDPDVVYLPHKVIVVIASASALESLTLAVPLNRNFAALADAVRSLHKLKVDMQA
jgi:hypothetical protein